MKYVAALPMIFALAGCATTPVTHSTSQPVPQPQVFATGLQAASPNRNLTVPLRGTGFMGSSGDATATLHSELQWLNLEMPESDAARDLANGQPHCYSTNGYGSSFPGVSNLEDHDFCSKVEVNFAGTSDAVEGNEHILLIAQAVNYAKRYNVYMMDHRK